MASGGSRHPDAVEEVLTDRESVHDRRRGMTEDAAFPKHGKCRGEQAEVTCAEIQVAMCCVDTAANPIELAVLDRPTEPVGTQPFRSDQVVCRARIIHAR